MLNLNLKASVNSVPLLLPTNLAIDLICIFVLCFRLFKNVSLHPAAVTCEIPLQRMNKVLTMHPTEDVVLHTT